MTPFLPILKSFAPYTKPSCRKGDCWDNAPTERFFRSLKYEHLLSCRLATREAARIETLEYITFYNADRLHSNLGYMSPMEFEQKELMKAAWKMVSVFTWPLQFGMFISWHSPDHTGNKMPCLCGKSDPAGMDWTRCLVYLTLLSTD